jgi:hypothetical protein
MREIIKKPIAQKRPLAALMTALLMLLICLPLAEAVSAATEVTVRVLVPQTFVINDGSPPSNVFAYRLTPTNRTYPDAPLPTGPADGEVKNGAYEYTSAGDEILELSFIFDRPGAYYYELECVTPNDREGYTLDKRVYAIEITVAANMSAVTVAYDKAIRKDKTNPAYLHSYKEPPQRHDDPNKVTIRKVLLDSDGKTIVPGTGDVFTVALKRNGTVAYTFTLKGNNSSDIISASQEDLSTGTYTVEETAASPNGLGSYDITYSTGEIVVTRTNANTVTVTNKLKKSLEGAHIAIDKRVDKTTAGPGQAVNYTLEVMNTGDEALDDLVIRDSRLIGYTGNLAVTLNRGGSSARILPASKYTFSRSAGTLSNFIEPNANTPLILGLSDKLFINYTLSFAEEGKYENTAIVTAEGVNSGDEVRAQDSVTVTVLKEWVDLDEDGTPLGIWRWDPELEQWIFEEFPPLAELPQTGQLRWPVPALAALGILLFIIGFALNRRRARNI